MHDDDRWAVPCPRSDEDLPGGVAMVVGPQLEDRPVRARGVPGFVGRPPELARLRDRIVRPGPGAARGIVLTGEAGLGKTRLVDELVSTLPATVRVLQGCGDPLQRDRPFGAIAAAVGPSLAEEVAHRDDATSQPAQVGPGARARLVDGFVAGIVAMARRTRVLLVVEDLQWVDAGTVAIVHELLDAGPATVSVIGTVRDGPRSPQLQELLGALVPRQLELVRLGPLSPEAVEDLVTVMIGHRPGPRLLAHVEGAGGNPLVVTELVEALADEGSLLHVGGAPDDRVELVGAGLPPSLRETLVRRLDTLPRPALDTLAVAALVGTTFDPGDLALVLGVPATEIVARLREPIQAGWVEARGTQLAFRHELMRAAVHDDTTPAVRRALHRQIAQRLLEAERSATTVARHLVLGSVTPDPDAARWLRIAGSDALASAPTVAVELLDAATTLDPTPSPWRDGTLLELGVASLWSGAIERGERVLRTLLERPHDPAVDADARLALARSAILGGRTGDALDQLTPPDGFVQPTVGGTRMAAERALTHLLRGELDDARTLADDVLAAGTDLGTDETRCLATAVRSALLAMQGRFADAVDTAEEAVAIATASPHRETARRPPQLFLGSVLIDSDRFAEGRRALHVGRRISEDLGAAWDLPVQHLVSARGRFLAGEHDDVLAEVETALEAAEGAGTRVLEVWGYAMVAHVHLHRGATHAAQRALAAGDDAMSVTGPQVRGTDWLLWARALLDELEGRAEQARNLLGLVWEAHGALGLLSERRLLGPDLTRLWLEADDLAAAGATVADVEANAAVAHTASARAAALRCRALLERDPDLGERAVAELATTDCRMEHATTALEAADLAMHAGRRERALALLTTARDLADAGGMLATSRRARAGLRDLGVHQGGGGDRDRPLVGWEALTPTERTVTALAADGLTNPEIGERLFVSRRTVQTHLSHVFAKLGIGSRVELAAIVARLDGPR